MRRAILACIVLAAAACDEGGDLGPRRSSGGTDITGTGTLPFAAVEAVSMLDQQTCAGYFTYGASFLWVAVLDAPGMCGWLGAGQDKAGLGGLVMIVWRERDGTEPPGIRIGAYDVASGAVVLPDGTYEAVSASVARNNAICQSTMVNAVGGTITIGSVTGGVVSGQVDLILSDGGRVTGGFSAPSCGLDPLDLCTMASNLPPTTTCLP